MNATFQYQISSFPSSLASHGNEPHNMDKPKPHTIIYSIFSATATVTISRLSGNAKSIQRHLFFLRSQHTLKMCATLIMAHVRAWKEQILSARLLNITTD